MRRKVSVAGSLIVCAWMALGTCAAFGQSAAPNTPRTAEVVDVLRRGQLLEEQRRWADALAHYEEAIRQFPNDHALERHFELARAHFDLGRRYADVSFREALVRLSPQEVFDLYDDVLLKIQSHYVEPMDWKLLVERGMNNLDVALGESAFLERNIAPQYVPAIDAFRRELRRLLGQRTVTSRQDARDAVRYATQLAQLRLGATAAPVVLEFLCGATNALDNYSAFLTPQQLGEVYSQIEGNFVGLGVELKPADGELTIVRVIPHSPAQQAGLVAGDRIVAVGDRLTRDYTGDQAANMLQGEVGSLVTLTVVGPGAQQPRQVRVIRQRVDVPSVDDVRLVDAGRGIAYLKLTCFQKNTAHDLDQALWQLHRQGMRSLIIDLRGNPGGLLVTAVEVVDKFVERGTIVSTRGRNPQEDFTYSARPEGTWRVPLTLLIDQDSASAAEIFAGAIRDHHRGTLVGVRSFGKGSVQGIFPLNVAGSGIRLTTAKFYSPAGKPFVRVGVEPDVAVQRVAKPVDGALPVAEDTMLAAALEIASQPLAPRQ